jgi:hypothetical protein
MALNLLKQTARVRLELLQLFGNTNSTLRPQPPKSSFDMSFLIEQLQNTIAHRRTTIESKRSDFSTETANLTSILNYLR